LLWKSWQKTGRLHPTDEEGHIRSVKERLYSSGSLAEKERIVNKEHSARRDQLRLKSNEYQGPKIASRQQVIYADQIMSSPVRTLSLGLSYEAAHAMFVKYRHRHFPVVDEKSQLVGLVSDRDMLADDGSLEGAVEPLTSKRAIINIMSKQILTASERTTIHEICRVMYNQHIGALPITDEKANLLGIITRSDILRTMLQNGPIELWV
jgi:acetoin utilization protein AcuB